LNDLTKEENIKIFSKTIYEHGHNYEVFITIKGHLNEKTQMVTDIREIKRIVNEILEKFYDHKNLNLENPFFKNKLPTTENLALSLWHFLNGELNLHSIEVYENENLFSEYKGGENVILGRTYTFSAGHKLYNENLSEEENFKLYGKCSNKNGHGHEYKLILYIEGKPDGRTGFIINIDELDKIVNNVLSEIDHRFLNYDVDYFKQHLPTTENLLLYFKMKLEKNIKKLKKIEIQETQNNIFILECE
jgi:6-pyruvoyltetrahydropterin/6-carboxytetrahydropterin synthase